MQKTLPPHLDDVLNRQGFLLESILSTVQGQQAITVPDASIMASSPAVSSILSLFKAWLWAVDKELKFTYISPHFTEEIGISPEIFRGKTRNQLVELYSSGGKAENIEITNNVYVLTKRRPFDNLIYHLDLPEVGRRWIKVSGRPLFDEKIRFIGYWGVASNVTCQQKKLLEKANRAALLVDALDAMDVSVLLLDEDHRISLFNRRWERLHKKLKPESYSMGTPYESYLRASIKQELFPEAKGREEEFIRDRISKNILPLQKPFLVERQDNIVLSIQVKQLADRSVLIVSTEIPKHPV